MNKFTFLLCIILIAECQSFKKRSKGKRHPKSLRKRHNLKLWLRKHRGLKFRKHQKKKRPSGSKSSHSHSSSSSSHSHSSEDTDSDSSGGPIDPPPPVATCTLLGFDTTSQATTIFNFNIEVKEFGEYQSNLFQTCAVAYNSCYDAAALGKGCELAFVLCQKEKCLTVTDQTQCRLNAASNLECLKLPTSYLQIQSYGSITDFDNSGCYNNMTYNCFNQIGTTNSIEIGLCSETSLMFYQKFSEGQSISTPLITESGKCLVVESNGTLEPGTSALIVTNAEFRIVDFSDDTECTAFNSLLSNGKIILDKDGSSFYHGGIGNGDYGTVLSEYVNDLCGASSARFITDFSNTTYV